MVSITVTLEKKFKERLTRFPWVNWSEVGREAVLKKDIFDRYVRTGRVSKEDARFCEKIDWHPADELPLRAEYVKKLKEIEKGAHNKMSLEELDRLLGLG